MCWDVKDFDGSSTAQVCRILVRARATRRSFDWLLVCAFNVDLALSSDNMYVCLKGTSKVMYTKHEKYPWSLRCFKVTSTGKQFFLHGLGKQKPWLLRPNIYSRHLQTWMTRISYAFHGVFPCFPPSHGPHLSVDRDACDACGEVSGAVSMARCFFRCQKSSGD